MPEDGTSHGIRSTIPRARRNPCTRRTAHTPPMIAATPRALVRRQIALESFSPLPRRGDHRLRAPSRRRRRLRVAPVLPSVPRWVATPADTRPASAMASPHVAPDGLQPGLSADPRRGRHDAVSQVLDPASRRRRAMAAHPPSKYGVSRLCSGARTASGSRSWPRPGDPRFVVGAESAKGRTPTARRITRTDFRDDETGHLGRRAHLWVTRARAGARPRQLTRGDYDVLSPTWAPDGTQTGLPRRIVAEDVNLRPRSQIWSVPPAARGGRVTGARQPRRRRGARPRTPRTAGASRSSAPTSTTHRTRCSPGLWVMDLPRATPRELTAGLDRPVGDWAWSDLVMAEDAIGPIWLDEASLLVLVPAIGVATSPTVSASTAASSPDRRLGHANGRGTGLEHDASSGRIAMSAGPRRTAAPRCTRSQRGGSAPQVTREGSRWQRSFGQPRIEELELRGPGRPDPCLAGLAAACRPPPPAPDHRLPRGGPTGSWATGSTTRRAHRSATLATGLLPNVRGSATFGADWVRPLACGWAGPRC